MKRIEAVKNRVKNELEVSVQDVDVKQQEFAEILDTKHKELQQILVKRKRFSDIWVSFDRRENDFLNQEIRIFRILDEINFLAGLNESEPVDSEEMSINDYPRLFNLDFFQLLERFVFSSIPIFFYNIPKIMDRCCRVVFHLRFYVVNCFLVFIVQVLLFIPF